MSSSSNREKQAIPNNLVEKINILGKRIDELWRTEIRILEELSMIKNKSLINHRELIRLEHITISLLEEISILKKQSHK